MVKNHVMIIGEKESFLTRVLIKKLADNNIDGSFVYYDIDDINRKWEGTTLITVYMDEDVRPKENVLHFLTDKMVEDGLEMIVVGSEEDIGYINSHVPKELLYKTFIRPLNNESYVNTVTEMFHKAESGEFKKRILIVDDDPNYLGLVREWLKSSYKVSMANSGLQAIKWLGKNKADLILLDYEMPITSGPKVLEMLRSDEDTRSIPVIFLTGKGDKESVMAVVELKPQGYFLKTIEREDLLEKLKEFFILHN
ncbi:MAG: response regulator [Lachnospiraceae bacterium]|nr:response regulator [Lachnospiraceae bacterium]